MIETDATGARRSRREVAQADQQPSGGSVVAGVEAVEKVRLAIVEEPARRVGHQVRHLDHQRERAVDEQGGFRKVRNGCECGAALVHARNRLVSLRDSACC